jgi:ketosteroid isomerase-like protein
MTATTPEQAVELLDRAFREKDLETVLSFYEEVAVVVAEPGKTLRSAGLRAFFAEAMRSGASAKQGKTWTMEADGIALFISRWVLTIAPPGQQPVERTFVATTVFRKQLDGTWKVLIDNPTGPLVLGA